MSKQDVVKASWVIHISHTLTLAQQQIWNVLLAYAYDNLATQDVHHLDIRILFTYVGKTRNVHYLKKTLKSLYETETYNIISKGLPDASRTAAAGKQTGERHLFNLLEYAVIKDGYCKYSFSPDLIPQLIEPVCYAKINLLTQAAFASKYPLILYELCVDYCGIERTPAFTIDRLKQYFGIAPGEYEEFKHFNYKIIKKAVAEVTKLSELEITAHYSTKKGCNTIYFTIKKKRSSAVDIAKLAQRVTNRPGLMQVERCPFKQLKEYDVAEKYDVPEKESDTSQIALNKMHKQYLERRLKEELNTLNNDQEMMLKISYEKWMAKHKFSFTLTGSDMLYRELFLTQILLCPQERLFEKWLKRQKR